MHSPRSHYPGARWLTTDEEVCRDVKIVAKRQVLKDHVDSAGPSVSDTIKPDLLTADEDVAFIGHHRAGHDLHERGLPGSVVANKADNLTLSYDEVNRFQGSDGAEELCDPPEFHDGRDTALRVRSVDRVSVHLFVLSFPGDPLSCWTIPPSSEACDVERLGGLDSG